MARAREDFDRLHEEIFAYHDRDSEVQFVGWRAAASCKLGKGELGRLAKDTIYVARIHPSRKAYFAETGMVDTRVVLFETMAPDDPLEGPAIIESPLTTVVIDPGATVVRRETGSLVITP